GFVLVLTIVTGLSAGLEPMILGRLVDAAAARDGRGLGLAVAALGALGLGGEALRGIAHQATWRTRIALNQDLLVATVSHVQRLPLAFHRQHGVGELLTKLDRGIQGLMSAFGELAFQVVPAIVYLATAAVVMVRLDARLAGIVLVFAPVPLLITA